MIFRIASYVGFGILSFWVGTIQTDSSEEKLKTTISREVEMNSSNSCKEIVGSATQLNVAKLKKEISDLKNNLKSIPDNNSSALNEHCKILSEKIDSGFFDEAYQHIYSFDDLKERKRNLKVLALLKNEEAKEELLRIANDVNEPLDIRTDVVRSIEWGGQVNEGIRLLHDEDDSIRSTLILAMNDSTLSDEEKETFQQELMSVFSENSGIFVQIVAIDYLANNNRSMLEQINVVSTDEEVSKTVTQHLHELSSNI